MWRAFVERVRRTPARGFSLLEVLVTGALFSVVIAGVYLLYTTMQGTLARGETKADLQQNARVGMDRLVQELRMAGYDPQNALANVSTQKYNEVRAAGNNCLSFVAYRKHGATETSVQITYRLLDTKLERQEDDWIPSTGVFGSSSTQPLADSVSQLAFTYYDVFNRILKPSGAVTGGCPPGSSPSMPLLDSAQAGQVRRVSVMLRTLEAVPRMPSESYTLTSHVYLRNR